MTSSPGAPDGTPTAVEQQQPRSRRSLTLLKRSRQRGMSSGRDEDGAEVPA